MDRELGVLADPTVDGDRAAVLLVTPEERLMASSTSASAASRACASSRSAGALVELSLKCRDGLPQIGQRVVEHRYSVASPFSAIAPRGVPMINGSAVE